MLENHIFKDEYLFIVNGPYKSLDRALFIHRGSWQQHSDKAKLQCTPVTETSLYR
jgi:hypothetical protein